MGCVVEGQPKAVIDTYYSLLFYLFFCYHAHVNGYSMYLGSKFASVVIYPHAHVLLTFMTFHRMVWLDHTHPSCIL